MVRLGLGLGLALATGCDDRAGFPDATPVDAVPPLGHVAMTWSVVDGARTVACADVGGITMTVGIRRSNSPLGDTEVFGCTSGTGTIDLAPGAYDFTFTITGGGGTIATVASQTMVDVVGGETTDLGALAFEVDAQGVLALSLFASGAGNCAGGAGIDSMAMTLTKGGTCVATSFDIGAGAVGAPGTYAVTCPAGASVRSASTSASCSLSLMKPPMNPSIASPLTAVRATFTSSFFFTRARRWRKSSTVIPDCTQPNASASGSDGCFSISA